SELQAAHERAQSTVDTRESERRALAQIEMQLVETRAQATAASADAHRIETERAAARERVDQLAQQQRESRERHRSAASDGPASAEPDTERTRLEDDLAKARTTIAAAEEPQTEAPARSADIRERLAGLTADRDAARARLGILDDDDERAIGAREVMLADIANLTEETRSLHVKVEGMRQGVTEGDGALERARQERERLAAQQLQ